MADSIRLGGPSIGQIGVVVPIRLKSWQACSSILTTTIADGNGLDGVEPSILSGTASGLSSLPRAGDPCERVRSSRHGDWDRQRPQLRVFRWRQPSPTRMKSQKLLKREPSVTTRFSRSPRRHARARLEAIFLSLKETSGPDDRLLVYYAGHGIAIGDDGRRDTLFPRGEPQRDQASSFLVDLADWLDGLSCRLHLLLVLDCCSLAARFGGRRDLDVVPEVIHKERYDRYIRDAAWRMPRPRTTKRRPMSLHTSQSAFAAATPGRRIIPRSPRRSSVVSVARRTSSLLPAKAGRPETA